LARARRQPNHESYYSHRPPDMNGSLQRGCFFGPSCRQAIFAQQTSADVANTLPTRRFPALLTGPNRIHVVVIETFHDFVFQRWRSLKFLDALSAEWNQYREKGRIKDDYMATEQHAECLQEMLDFIDSSPDQIRFATLKKILLVTAAEGHSSRDSVLPQQYMRVIRELTSGEVLVLLTTYTLEKRGGQQAKHLSAGSWLEEVAGESGLQYPELVAVHEEKLMAKHLLTSRHLPDRSGVSRAPYNRLTQFGYQLCEFISHYSDVSSA
jgi:hypothetical protein